MCLARAFSRTRSKKRTLKRKNNSSLNENLASKHPLRARDKGMWKFTSKLIFLYRDGSHVTAAFPPRSHLFWDDNCDMVIMFLY
jgi:hypothetical protein